MDLWCQGHSGTNRIDANTKWGEIHRHVTRHLQHGGLRSAVNKEVRLSDKSRNRAQIDDRATTGLPHLLHCVLSDQSSSDYVYAQRLLPFIDCGLETLKNERCGVID